MTSSLCRLRDLGQSVWLDDIDRPMLLDGSLATLIENDCIGGQTSNPVIFERALKTSDAYDGDIATMAAGGAGLETVYERLIEDDIRRAADLFAPLHQASARRDGYVSLEVSPHLARDTEGTIAEAVRLWTAVDRANVMIKVPGTREGLDAIRALIARGININVTLLFDPIRYREVTEAFVAGLEDRISGGAATGPHPHSVASFFLSRIDSMVDPALDARGDDDAKALRGETAIALARIAYRHFAEMVETPRWKALAEQGAAPQRLLWASTGTKDKAYSDVKYVEPLVAADTVNTMPRETLAAFREHGTAELTLTGVSAGPDLAEVAAKLAASGLDLPGVLARLEEEGIEKFNTAFDNLHKSLAAKVAAVA